jgi:hypothetical protein
MPRRDIQAEIAAQRERIERLRRREPPFPERLVERPLAHPTGADGGYKPHPAFTPRPPAPLEAGDAEMPREIPISPETAERLLG